MIESLDLAVLTDLIARAAVLAPIITGLVAVLRGAKLSSEYLPVAAIAIGAIFGWFFIAAAPVGLLVGVAVGLSSVGLYEFGKSTIAGK